MKRNALLTLSALAAGSLMLTGCSGSGSADPAASVAEATDIASCTAEGTTLKIAYAEQGQEAVDLATEALAKEYPGLDFELLHLGAATYDDMTKTIVADIAVGNRPDVIMSGLGQLRFWVDEYSPAPIEREALADTYQDQFLSAGSVDGTTYLAPAQISAPVLMVNQDLLDAAGAGQAADIKSYADWIAAAEKVTKHTGEPSVGIGTNMLANWYSQAFVQGAEGTFINEDGSAGFNDEIGREALGIWSEMRDRGLELGNVDDQDNLTQFYNGKAAFVVYSTSVISTAEDTIDGAFNWVPVDVPTANGKTGAMPAGGNGWVVLSDDSCRAAYSNALVGELLSPNSVVQASGNGYSYIPVDAAAAKELLAQDNVSPQLEFAWSYDAPLSPWGGFSGKVTGQINDIFKTMTQKLQAGEPTDATVEETVQTIDALVEQNK